MIQSCAMIYLPGGMPTPVGVVQEGSGGAPSLRRPVEWQVRVTHLALPSFGRGASSWPRPEPCIVFFDLFSGACGRKEAKLRKRKGLDASQMELLGRFGPGLGVREFRLNLTLAGVIAAPELSLSLAGTLRQLVGAGSGRAIEEGRSCFFWRPGHGGRYQCGMCAPLGGNATWTRDA